MADILYFAIKARINGRRRQMTSLRICFKISLLSLNMRDLKLPCSTFCCHVTNNIILKIINECKSF